MLPAGSIGAEVSLFVVAIALLVLPLALANAADAIAKQNPTMAQGEKDLYAMFLILAPLAIFGFCFILTDYASAWVIVVYAVLSGYCVAASWVRFIAARDRAAKIRR